MIHQKTILQRQERHSNLEHLDRLSCSEHFAEKLKYYQSKRGGKHQCHCKQMIFVVDGGMILQYKADGRGVT
jgi:hypothetical protein